MNVQRLAAWALPLAFFALPLFPAFITLTPVTPPGVALLSPSVTLGLLIAMAALAIPIALGAMQPPLDLPPTFWPLILWFAATVLSAALGFAPLASAVFLGISLLSIVWHVAIWRFYPAPRVARNIFTAFAVSGLLASLAAIAMVLARFPATQYAVGHGRAIGTFVLPGELAGFLIIYLATMYALASIAQRAERRFLFAAGFACGLVALFLTHSRAGWAGFVFAGAFYLFALGDRRLRIYSAAVLVAGIAIIVVELNARHNPSENYTRLPIWESALRTIRRFPLTGVGPFNFSKTYALVRPPGSEPLAFHAHSVILTIASETGLLGLAAALATWIRFTSAFRTALRSAGARSRALALGIAAGLVGTWVQGVIDTVSVVLFGMWLPFMALALACAARTVPGEEVEG